MKDDEKQEFLVQRRYFIIDGWTQLGQQEAVGDHGKNTQGSGEQNGQPYAGLVQGVPSCSWTNNTAAAYQCFKRQFDKGLNIARLQFFFSSK